MKVQEIFVVMEDDRGCGPSLKASYISRKLAEKHADESGHYFVEQVLLLDFQDIDE